MYAYVRSRQLEGTYPGSHETGCWPMTDLRVRRGWGQPSESDWPYDGKAENWPPTDPPDIDQKAKQGRISAYQRVRNLTDAKHVLASGVPFAASFEISSADWNSPNGAIPVPRDASTIDGGHTVLISGYDDKTKILSFINSWGEAWGDKGCGTLSYDYFDKHMTESLSVIPGGMSRPVSSVKSGNSIQCWALPAISGSAVHVIDLFDLNQDECIGWALIAERDGNADIEDLFVRPSYRGRGYGTLLVTEILRNKYVTSPLRLWLAHVDAADAASPPSSTVLSKLGLTLRPSPERWASGLAT